MEYSDFCYYIVPAVMGAFGLGMTMFLRKSLHVNTRIESELEKLDAKTKSKKYKQIVA